MSKNICVTMNEQQAQIVYELLRTAVSLSVGNLDGVWRFVPVESYPHASNYLEERVHYSNLKVIVSVQKKVQELRLGADPQCAERISKVKDMCKDFSNFFAMVDPDRTPESRAELLAIITSVPRGSSPCLSIVEAD